MLHSLMMLQISFYRDLKISTFFVKLIRWYNLVMYFSAVLLGDSSLAGLLYTSFGTVFSICGISSHQGKYKAFSTCASHLSVVFLFYCTSLGVYLSSAASQSSHSSAIASVMYTLVTPMLNPFIYSLRNKEIKGALRRFFGMASTKGPVILGQKKCPGLQDSKPQSQNCASLITLQK